MSQHAAPDWKRRHTCRRHSCSDPAPLPALRCLTSLCALLLLGLILGTYPAAAADPTPVPAPTAVLTNILQLRQAAAQPHPAVCSLRLEGVVLWTSAAQDQLILQDASGGIPIQMDLRAQPRARSGQGIRLEGKCLAGAGSVCESLIDNDGTHSERTNAATLWLNPGLQPLRLAWFNGPGTAKLQLDYAGPDLPRQPVPEAALFRAETVPAGAVTQVVHGLNYLAYEGSWERLPVFSQLTPVKTGSVAQLDLGPRSRAEEVGLVFDGFLYVPRAGAYTFWLTSDDGSRLFIGESSLRLRLTGADAWPQARVVAPGQVSGPESDCTWGEVEGRVTFVQLVPAGGAELQLGVETNSLCLDVQTAERSLPPLFSRIRAAGVLRHIGPPDRRTLGLLQVPDLKHVVTLESSLPAPNLRPATVAELSRLGASGQRTVSSLQVEGRVLATSPSRQIVAFGDASGAALMELGKSQLRLQPGQNLRLAGSCTAEGTRLIWRPLPLVDNDGIHLQVERHGTAFLSAGKHPLRLTWMNRELPASLEVLVEGPDWLRHKIPDSILFHPVTESNGTIRWTQGLHYRVYHGAWAALPEFSQLDPVRLGTTANFDLDCADQLDQLGLEFSGYIEVPRDGAYIFSTASDDGSLLYVDSQPLRLQSLGSGAVPAPRPLAAGQSLSQTEAGVWAEASGTVTFVGESAGGYQLELSSGAARLRVEVAEATGLAPLLLLNSRIQATGVCRSTFTSDGQTIGGILLVPGVGQIRILEVAASLWDDYPILPIGRITATNFLPDPEAIIRVRGQVRRRGNSPTWFVEDSTGRVCVETSQSLPRANTAIEVLGRWSRRGSKVVLQSSFFRPLAGQVMTNLSALPLLTTVEQIKGLSREQAQSGYPAKIRGVITTPLDGGFFIQDHTWGIYCRWPATPDGDQPRVGDYWEVEGVTFAEFAPNIRAQRAVRLGPGTLPEPLRPTWDQLINGSLDTQYVEVQGIVTGVENGGVILLTRAGKIRVELPELPMATLRQYENALIRVRGCVIPGRNATTQQVELGQMRLSNASVNVDEPSPADPFSAPLKRASDLLQFDSRAGAIQRVRIAGQILHHRGAEYFLFDGTNGLRFVPKVPVQIQTGDLVEVVGFPELGGPSPILREALTRSLGRAELPAPHRLLDADLLRRQHDATLVRVESRLINLNLVRSDQVLEVQSGTRGFVARMELRHGSLPSLIPGSRLELTGVYVGQGGDPVSGRDIDSFELLLNSPAAIRVLERPPWWTLRHTVTIVAGMTLAILAALVWISWLRRQVEERSQELTVEMRRHEQTQRQRVLEEERARIAQDLHDDLGATLTQIKLLATLESRDAHVPEAARSRMRQISDKSRAMVTSLDEIVWAVNPANDSLPSLATYLCQFAEEFFRSSPLRCRLDVDDSLPHVPLTSEVRHNLYLAVREALNNTAKHSQATEAWLRIHWQQAGLDIQLEDNGQGFTPDAVPGQGLANMRRRLEKIGGQFTCETHPGKGTVCRLRLPWP